jgi:putative aldouronate transport system substrate-binding protein
MSYDYNQTQTIMNNTKLDNAAGEEYTVIMVPVAKWDDGDGAKFMRFTESWRSAKTEGWALTVAGCAADKNKLNAALTLIDYAFSVQGQITMSYGPDAFIKVKDASVEVKTWEDVAKKYETFNFNGVQMPVVADATFAECQNLTGGNYTNYARQYLGSTLNGFPKSQAFEYQMTHEIGKKGAAILSAGIAKGVIKHPLLTVNTANMWYTQVPTVFPTTAEQTNTLNGYTDLSTRFSTSKGGESEFYNIIVNGYGSIAGAEPTAQGYADFVKNNWSGQAYLLIKQAQWKVLNDYYNNNK